MISSVSQYAGQQLLTGQQAEAYADHFIAVHIAEMGGGKTYSQLSAQSLAQPANTQLAATVGTVFKGETLRSMLLNAYGWWKVSQITYIASLVMFGLGTVSFLGGLFGFARTAATAPARSSAAPRPSSRSLRPVPPPKVATLTACLYRRHLHAAGGPGPRRRHPDRHPHRGVGLPSAPCSIPPGPARRGGCTSRRCT
jgi:hypothetical protein